MNFKKIYLESTSKFQEGLFSFGIDSAAKTIFNIIYNFSWSNLVMTKAMGICYSNANGDLIPLYTWIRSPDYNLVKYLKVIDKAFRKDCTRTHLSEKEYAKVVLDKAEQMVRDKFKEIEKKKAAKIKPASDEELKQKYGF